MTFNDFTFEPAPFVPFRDHAVVERLRKMTPEEIVQHPNPNFKIHISLNIGSVEMGLLITRFIESDRENKPFVFICGNPNPGTYEPLTQLINYLRVNCRNVYPVTMDEWADENDNIAPANYRHGFTNSFLKYFYAKIDPELRMPLENILYPTNENIASYTDIIEERGEGGAHAIFSGPGWAGHIAFIDPCPELIPDYREGGTAEIKDLNDPYFEQRAQVLTLHPLTIAQNSLHGVFGCSGDLTSVPPKAATIGPRDVLNSREKFEFHGLTTMGTFSSWQRMTSRLITHGPVTPYVPGSIYQLMDVNVYLSPSIATPIEIMETTGY
ncbi:MAG: hypothetical protein GX900_08455 [Clostridiaceae bacterium]|nr:hypothetical protein [Clostridiaceae bacterium]